MKMKQQKSPPDGTKNAAVDSEIVTGHAFHYPDDEIMQALQGKETFLAGMFDNSAGDDLELRSEGGQGWTDSVSACGENTAYIRPRSARNTRGRYASDLLILIYSVLSKVCSFLTSIIIL